MRFSFVIEHKIGDVVFVKIDPYQKRNVVRGYLASENEVLYELKDGEGNLDYYFPFEITTEEDKTYKIDNL